MIANVIYYFCVLGVLITNISKNLNNKIDVPKVSS